MDKILIRMKTRALGDTIGASPYFEKKRIISDKEVYVSCHFHELFQPLYPKLKFLPFGFKNTSLFQETYDLDFKFEVPLQQGFSDQLGLEYEEIRPRVFAENSTRPLPSRYVGVAFQSTTQSRYWNRPGGWDFIFKKLIQSGITPVCLDHHQTFGVEGHYNTIPSLGENKTGLPLDEVIRYIQHCDFFMGLSTGLSWLALALGKQVVWISGSTHEWCEPTSGLIRIINKNVCHGCFNEPHKTPFDPGDWLWCPHHKGTPSQFICSSSITPEEVWEQTKPLLIC